MTNFNFAQILRMANQGVDPNRLTQMLIKQNPAVRQAAQMMNGKTPEQIRDMALNMAKQRGVDLNQMARQWGINLPK